MILLTMVRTVMKYNYVITVFMFLALISNVSAQDRYMGEAMFESTMDQYVQGNYDAAVRGFLRYLEMNPRDFNGQYLLARSYLFLGQKEKALKHFNEALVINPSDIEANIFAGRLLLNRNDYDSASRHFFTVLDQLPNDAETLALMALAENGRENGSKALEYCQKSMVIDSGRVETLVTYARILFASGKKEMTIQYLDKAQKAEKISDDLLVDMAVLYMLTGYGATADSLVAVASISDSTASARYKESLNKIGDR